MIIGITGLLGAGKDTVGEYLMERSFYHISLSDMIREELKKRNIPENIPNLQKVANEMRMQSGAGVLAERAKTKMNHEKHWVVTSIRTPGEVEILQQRKDFVLVFIDAPAKVRYERIIQRDRAGDQKTFAEFVKQESTELKGDAHQQQLLAVKKLANIHINNEGTPEELYAKIDKMLQSVFQKYRIPRPGWDDYYMGIAKEVAKRSNCMKRKIAAIIVKDNRIISTGYNGTPRGVPNCDEGGCKRCNSFAKGGTALDECICSHGEENAIVQAAYHGISVKGGTLYTTMSPCTTCSKMAINAGIVKVIYNGKYPLSDQAMDMLKKAGITLLKKRM